MWPGSSNSVVRWNCRIEQNRIVILNIKYKINLSKINRDRYTTQRHNHSFINKIPWLQLCLNLFSELSRLVLCVETMCRDNEKKMHRGVHVSLI